MDLPEQLRTALESGFPSTVVTCSGEGVPNTTYISEVFWVDGDHLALSHQFFSKTKRNLMENPLAQIWVPDVMASAMWVIDLQYDRSETEGDLFDAMEMHLDAIASAQGMTEVFQLKAADVFRVQRYARIPTN